MVLSGQEVDERLRELHAEVARLEEVRADLVRTRRGRRRSTEDAGELLELTDEVLSRAAVLADASEMATYLQEHLGQKLTAYLAGLRNAKMVGQWAQGKVSPPAVTRERLRAAYHATLLLSGSYGDEAARGWFFGANSSLDDRAPAAVLREAEDPDEMAAVAPLARAFVRGAH